MKHKTLFISDLHLDPAQPAITNAFLYFLEHIAPDADALYILGDFFESYVGDDDKNDFVKLITRALSRAAESGLSIFFMHGNRDFLVGPDFLKSAGMTFLKDPTVITLYNQKILLLHGDSLCIDDKAHQRFRKITGNKIIQTIFFALPLSLRLKMTKKIRTESKKSNQMKPKEIMDVNETAVKQTLKKYTVTKMIHGHTHRPQLSENRIVLDAWHDHGNYLQIDQDGKIELINFPL